MDGEKKHARDFFKLTTLLLGSTVTVMAVGLPNEDMEPLLGTGMI